MLLGPSPAHAASSNASTRIAARCAELPKMQSVFPTPRAAGLLDRSRPKWNSHLSYRGSAGPHHRRRPACIRGSPPGNGKSSGDRGNPLAVGAVMPDMPLMMAAHLGIGVEDVRLHMRG